MFKIIIAFMILMYIGFCMEDTSHASRKTKSACETKTDDEIRYTSGFL